MRPAIRLLCGRLGQCGVRSPLSECEMGIYKNRPVFGFHPQLVYFLTTIMSAPTQTTTPTASTTTSMDWTRVKSEELRALTDDEDDVANVKRVEKRHHKQVKAEERACRECEEAAKRAHEEAERKARVEAEQRACAEAEWKAKEEVERKAHQEFAKLQAEWEHIFMEKAKLMAEDKRKAEAERWAEVAAGKQKAGEPVKKRAREEPVTGSSGVRVVDLQ